ncbi:rod shape-determining protein MreC [Oecophyllibacter saccharovorans]|uniref:Cell shape-determining protein MreC n=1 Tax=Oecophyllibacter saccharovorans TaxID=2558360 RepID=A0A506UMA0_9PROT|nr:rod shape-determining protein MreC [Oecophyllibacter saccharovorans]TPW34449.1 rod shape-determining protein MreC [Oecophyllibacter saccharovorans]
MFSIQARQLFGGFVLPVLVLVAVAIVLLGQIWPQGPERVRLVVLEGMGPIYRVLTWPEREVQAWRGQLQGLANLQAENTRLRTENTKLLHWYNTAVTLGAENARLKGILHWGAEVQTAFVSGQVIREEDGPYLRAVLIDTGTQHLPPGALGVDANGLVGRVSEAGPQVVRLLLVTDTASRLPVTMQPSGTDAMMVGDNTPVPRLMYFPQSHPPQEGERVETRRQSGLMGGVPIGHVHFLGPGHPAVLLDADLDHLDIVRVFSTPQIPDPPPAEGRVREHPPLHATDPQAETPSVLHALEKFMPFTKVEN